MVGIMRAPEQIVSMLHEAYVLLSQDRIGF